MQTQDEFRSAEAQLGTIGFAQLSLQSVEAREERFNLGIELPARRRQAERRPPEEPHAEVRFKRRHLSADRRLLDAVRDVPDRGADAAMLRHIVEKLEVMDVHGATTESRPFTPTSNDLSRPDR